MKVCALASAPTAGWHRTLGVKNLLLGSVVFLLGCCLSACDSERDGSRPTPSSPGQNEEPAEPAQPGASPTIFGSPLKPAAPRVIPLVPAPNRSAIALDANPDAWRGERSHLAGTAHYDQGEWIYEDYPWTAYGAAQPGSSSLYDALGALGDAFDPARRLPGGLAFVIPQAGAGPLVDEADLSELRLAVRDAELYVLARTTTMRDPVRTALLLLFDTGRAGAERTVPFGSGLSTRQADTAALVTANGTRIVDLLTGGVTDAPAAADPTDYINALQTRLPLARISMAGGSQVRLVGATGLVEPGAYQLVASGAAGPLAKVVPRFDEPVQSVHDRLQALALAAHDIDRFFTTISLDRLRAGDSERLLPGVGYSVRTFVAPEAISSEGGTNGTLREYGLYLPQGFADKPMPATLLLRGSSMTAHSLAAITPGLFQNLGDENGAIVISPGGRSPADFFQGAVYRDVLQALQDAQALLPVDPDRLSVAGYSMGGYATYMFAATQPDRFAAAFVIEGLVGGDQPATILYPPPDVVPMLANLYHTPVAIFQGDLDVNVPVTNALAAVERLRTLGFRYRFNLLPANTHFTPGILNDYGIGARYLRHARRANAPSRVRFSRSMPYERAVDTAETTDQPAAGQSVGLRFNDAWFVHGLEASDTVNGTAEVDVRSFARPAGPVTPVLTMGIDTGPAGGQAASPYEEQAWETGPVSDGPRNALDAQLSGVAYVRLDLADMALTTAQPLAASIHTDVSATVAFTLASAGCITVSRDGLALPVQTTSRTVEVALPQGDHLVQLRPCGQ